MKIIGAGLGRTGTTSLQAALELLGFGPCYHMTELLKNPAHAPFWQAATDGQKVDWQTFFRDYTATVDAPGFPFYKDLMVSFPEAKVLLSVRDPERWYDSSLATIYAIGKRFPMSVIGYYIPRMGPVFKMADQLIWRGFFANRFLDRAYAIEQYNRHNQAVKEHVPPERLLVFDVKEGWEPLCRFLGVPVPPGVPFPHLNDTAEFRRHIVRIRVATAVLLGAVVGGAVALGCGLRRRLSR